MKLNLKIISLFLILFFITISFASASEIDNMEANGIGDIEISDTNDFQEIDEVSEEITEDASSQEKTPLSASNTKTFADLRSQIVKANAGDTIVLDSDYAYNSGFSANGVTIDKKLTIDGKGHTLDGKKSGRIITAYADNIVLKNIIFVNGKNEGSGAITCPQHQKLTLINCTFKNNAATNGIAGAVFLKNNNHKVINCTFISNTATKSGGAIRVQGNHVLIENCTFKNNRVSGSDFLGGAICALGNYNTIKNNAFSNNAAGRDGGAIDIEGSEAEKIGKGNVVTGNTFTNNSAKFGGAISANCQNITISNNVFSKNYATANGLGGAIRIAGTKSNTGKITGNTFNGNYAPQGGAIFINGNGTTVSQNTFKSNKATAKMGGTIDIRGNSNTVTKNSIDTSSSKTSGGAIYADGSSFKLTYNNITKATSGSNGGGAIIIGASATVTNNIFKSNTATTLGGALQVKGNKATVTSNQFLSNTAKSNNGGGIYIESNNAVLKSNDFEANTAKNGYSLYGKGSKPTISNNNLININSQSKVLVWVNYTIPAQNKVNKTNEPEPVINNTIPDNRIVTKIIYEDMNTSTVNQKVEGRIGDYFVVKLVDNDGNALAGLPIKIGLNGKVYDKNTTSNGVAKLQINLIREDVYTFAICFLGDDDYQGSFAVAKITVNNNNPKPNKANENATGDDVTVVKTITSNATSISCTDMNTTSVLSVDGRVGKYFTVKLLDGNGKPLAGLPIKIGFNGVIYEKMTNSSGGAKLQINLLRPSIYTFAVAYLGDPRYQGSCVVAKITVNAQTPKLTAGNKTFKASAKTKTVTAKLLTAHGNPLKSNKLTFTINGKTYTGKTNSNGVASVNISLNKKGTYSCVVKYGGITGCTAKSIKTTVKII